VKFLKIRQASVGHSTIYSILIEIDARLSELIWYSLIRSVETNGAKHIAVAVVNVLNITIPNIIYFVRRYHNMGDITVLTARRGQIKAVLTRFQTYIRSAECNITQVVPRRKKLEEAWYNFESVQSEIEDLDHANHTNHSEYREDFENLYFEIIAQAEQMTNTNRPEINTNEQGEASPRTSSRVGSSSSASSTIKLAPLKVYSHTAVT